jgi:hypothetical protein
MVFMLSMTRLLRQSVAKTHGCLACRLARQLLAYPPACAAGGGATCGSW